MATPVLSPAPAAAVAKRRKLLANADEDEMKITDLPEWAIREIIDYIPNKTSRAFLALALTTDSASWREIHWNKSAPKSILSWFKCDPRGKMKRPSAISKIILSPRNADEENLWEEIDFADFGQETRCWALRDDDIAGMLACINSVKLVKSLRLTNCVNITGRALEPLRGSVVLERLDLSLVGNHDPAKKVSHLHKISEVEVIPILNSIIDRENHSLQHIQFPYTWRKNQSGYFERFLEKYNQTEYQQSIRCQNLYCNIICHESLSRGFEDRQNFGLQHFTCYDCLGNYCYNCKDDNGHPVISICTVCHKLRCNVCTKFKSCRSCRVNTYYGLNEVTHVCGSCEIGSGQCETCETFYCSERVLCSINIQTCKICNRSGCFDCIQILYCSKTDCNQRNCVSCVDNGATDNIVRQCDKCQRSFCFLHMLAECKQNRRNCRRARVRREQELRRELQAFADY